MAYQKHWSQKHFGNRSSQKTEQLCAPDAALETGEGGRGQPNLQRLDKSLNAM